MVSGSYLAEDDKYRAGWVEEQGHRSVAILFRVDRRGLDDTGVGMPKFRGFTGDAEFRFDRRLLIALVGDEVDVSAIGLAVLVDNLFTRVGTLEAEITDEMEAGEDFGYWFAP